MIRQAAAVVVVLLLSPSWVTAQGTELTVNVASASVHKSPTNTSPTLGIVGRGARLEVTREVGDWVKVAYPPRTAWARAKEHGHDGTRRRLQGADPGHRGAHERAANATGAAPGDIAGGRASPDRKSPPMRTAAPQRGTASHMFGLGAHLGGPTFGIGGSARAWAHGRFGLQFELSRYEVSSPIDLER